MFASRFLVTLLFPAVLMALSSHVSGCEKHQSGAASAQLHVEQPPTFVFGQDPCPGKWSPITCCVPPTSMGSNPAVPQSGHTHLKEGHGSAHGGQDRSERSQVKSVCVDKLPTETTCQYTCTVCTSADAHNSHQSYGASVSQSENKKVDGAPQKGGSSNNNGHGAHQHGHAAAAAQPTVEPAASPSEADASELNPNSARPSNAAVTTMGLIVMAILACIFA